MKNLLPSFFSKVRVVDFGSLDINGSNRELFADSEYVGVDLGPGRNVDVVCQAAKFKPDVAPDVVISTEMLEHDADWINSVANMVRILRPGGLLLLTCATEGRPEHGTRRADPEASPYTHSYYQNLTTEDLDLALKPDRFHEFHFEVNQTWCDLYFWGVKSVDMPGLR